MPGCSVMWMLVALEFLPEVTHGPSDGWTSIIILLLDICGSLIWIIEFSQGFDYSMKNCVQSRPVSWSIFAPDRAVHCYRTAACFGVRDHEPEMVVGMSDCRCPWSLQPGRVHCHRRILGAGDANLRDASPGSRIWRLGWRGLHWFAWSKQPWKRGWQMKDGMAPQVSNPKFHLTSWILMTMAQNHGTNAKSPPWN